MRFIEVFAKTENVRFFVYFIDEDTFTPENRDRLKNDYVALAKQARAVLVPASNSADSCRNYWSKYTGDMKITFK